jgi:hypothetical protein
MDAPSQSDAAKSARNGQLARIALVILAAVLALGAWQGFGVLMYGIEASYDL